jgi:hypothetical protein
VLAYLVQSYFAVDSGKKAAPEAPVARQKRKSTAFLLDVRRTSNCEILLTSLKMSKTEVVAALMEMDEGKLNESAIESLRKFAPTKEEEVKLRAVKDLSTLRSPAEQLLREVIDIPRFEAKVSCFAFKVKFSAQVLRLTALF